MKYRRTLAATVAGLVIIMSAYGATAQQVDVRELVQKRQAFLGKTVSFTGCLVNASPHGEYIQPCGNNDWRNIIIVSASSFKGMQPFGIACKAPSFNCIHCARGTYVVTLVTTKITWPKEREIVTIELQSFSNISVCNA